MPTTSILERSSGIVSAFRYLLLFDASDEWPAAVGFDDLIYLTHDLGRLVESFDDLLVVLDVFVREVAALAVLEPLVEHLVATDPEGPYLLRNDVKVLPFLR